MPCNRWFLAALLPVMAVGFLGATCAAAEDVLAFHVKDRDFKPVEVADWVYDGVVKVFVTPVENAPAVFDEIDKAAADGATVIHTSGFDPYYPLVRDDPKSGLSPAKSAAIRAAVARAKSHGMRVIFGIGPIPPLPIVKAHPTWLLYPTDEDWAAKTLQFDLTRPENLLRRSMGLNTPYGDYLIECLAEAMKEYQLDGYSFDGHYHPALNYSPYEKTLYKKETGRTLPAHADLNSLEYRLYLIWADDQLENWYRKLHQRLREVNPQAAIYTWTTNAGRYGHFLTSPRVMSTRMNLLFDSPIQEWWMDEVNLGASVVPLFGAAYVRAVSGDRTGACDPYLMTRGNPYCTESMPPHEVFVRSMSAITQGAIVVNGVGNEASRAATREIARRKPWLIRTETLPWAALLVSEQTRQFYAYGQIMDRFLSHALGVFRVACEEHLAVQLINDWDITPETLARYRVLILPNAACLSDEQVKTIRDFVAAGGGLVATCETSMFDEIGRPRADFALGDLFGVTYEGRIKASGVRPTLDANFEIVVDEKYWSQRTEWAVLRWEWVPEFTEDARLRLLTPAMSATFKGPVVKISKPRPPMRKAMFMFPEAGAETPPCAAMGEFGKGRVFYFALGMDAANFSYGFPYERILLARAIEWAAREPFAIRVEAPMCVQSTFFQQSNATGRRIIVHLFNGINTTSNHGLLEVDVPLREETLPISGIKLRFAGLGIKRFHLEPEGSDLSPTTDGDTQVIEVPTLAVHSMVVAERQ
jgi:hypothetical protein